MLMGSGGRAVRAVASMALVASLSAGCGDGGGGDNPGPNPSEPYSAPLAAELCRLCLEAYQQLTDFQNGQPFDLPAPYTLRQQYYTPERYAGEPVAAADTEVPIAFVATAGETIFVVFRGTQTISEWIDDATFGQVAYTYVSGGGKTEKGFTSIYETLHEPIVQTVMELIAAGGYTTLYVTGHSLGAALATLAAPELQARTSLQPVLYNFASPRVGNPTFVQRYDGLISTSWRVANSNDVVPELPPKTVPEIRGNGFKLLFYRHVDNEEVIMFGQPVTDPLDVQAIEFNHSACNYYATLCDETPDPTGCKQLVGDTLGCHLS